MSHQPGTLRIAGEIVGWFEYNGTVDIARSQIFPDEAALVAWWRKEQPLPCDCPGEPVELSTETASWDGRACFAHACVVEGRRTWGHDE
jgi:hypothetical protein